MRRTLLAIGDLTLDGVKAAPSVNKFIWYKKNLIGKNIGFEFITYDEVFLRKLPKVLTNKVKVMLFFPYNYWNNNIERYNKGDFRIYGDENFGREYKAFFWKIDRIIRRRYRGKSIKYVNPPQACILDRDKFKTTIKLNKQGILTPKIYNLGSLDKFYQLLKNNNLYIKPPFGAMGKGITYVTKDACFTNFIFKDNEIISRPYDYNWDFIKIPARKRDAFINILIRKKFLFEEAIRHPVVKRRKFDLRIYLIYGDVPYFYARSAPDSRFITNWSQGGRIEGKRFLRRVLSKKKIKEILFLSKSAARILGLNYAGIDVLLDNNIQKAYLLEAHSFPGYERGFNLMKFLTDKI